jgi:SAM-dependent methyltransferase
LEVIEHLRNPFVVLKELNRILKSGGSLIISTPNILNLSSRLRFLFEGAFEFFREPLLDQVNSYNGDTKNLHLIPWRYQELEYALYESGFSIAEIYTDKPNLKAKMLGFLTPFLRFQSNAKRKRSEKKSGVSYSRINEVLLSDELLYGRHLILESIKEKQY